MINFGKRPEAWVNMAGIFESSCEAIEEFDSARSNNDQVENPSRSCPRNIILKDTIVDIAIHPRADIIAGAKISGMITVCSFSSTIENKKIFSLKHHKKACRSISFSPNGDRLFTSSKDKTIQVVDMSTGKVVNCIKNTHRAQIYRMVSISDRWIATGDEKGCVKLWDIDNQKCFAEFTENTDFISDMVCDDEKRNLICTCGDGTLSVFNVRGKKVRARSDQLDTELLTLAIVKGGTKVVCGGGDGTLSIYSWGRWGDISDRFPGHPTSVDALCKVDENIVVTGDSDGKIRSLHVQPNYFISEIGKHGKLPIERLQLSSDGGILASCSFDKIIKFWDIRRLHHHSPLPLKSKTRKRKTEAMQASVTNFFADL